MDVKLLIFVFFIIAQTFAQEKHEILVEKTDEPAKKHPKFAMIADDDTLKSDEPRYYSLFWTRDGDPSRKKLQGEKTTV